MHIIRLLIMQLPPHPCYLVPPKPKYSPRHKLQILQNLNTHNFPTVKLKGCRMAYTGLSGRGDLLVSELLAVSLMIRDHMLL